MYVFTNQDISIGGVIGFCSVAQNIPSRFARGGKHKKKVAVFICTIKSLCCEVTIRGCSCTCVLYLSTDLAVFGTEVSAFGNILR